MCDAQWIHLGEKRMGRMRIYRLWKLEFGSLTVWGGGKGDKDQVSGYGKRWLSLLLYSVSEYGIIGRNTKHVV